MVRDGCVKGGCNGTVHYISFVATGIVINIGARLLISSGKTKRFENL